MKRRQSKKKGKVKTGGGFHSQKSTNLTLKSIKSMAPRLLKVGVAGRVLEKRGKNVDIGDDG